MLCGVVCHCDALSGMMILLRSMACYGVVGNGVGMSMVWCSVVWPLWGGVMGYAIEAIFVLRYCFV